MKKFRYRQRTNIDTKTMDELGYDGWELVTAVKHYAGTVFYFKKAWNIIDKPKRG